MHPIILFWGSNSWNFASQAQIEIEGILKREGFHAPQGKRLDVTDLRNAERQLRQAIMKELKDRNNGIVTWKQALVKLADRIFTIFHGRDSAGTTQTNTIKAMEAKLEKLTKQLAKGGKGGRDQPWRGKGSGKKGDGKPWRGKDRLRSRSRSRDRKANAANMDKANGGRGVARDRSDRIREDGANLPPSEVFYQKDRDGKKYCIDWNKDKHSKPGARCKFGAKCQHVHKCNYRHCENRDTCKGSENHPNKFKRR